MVYTTHISVASSHRNLTPEKWMGKNESVWRSWIRAPKEKQKDTYAVISRSNEIKIKQNEQTKKPVKKPWTKSYPETFKSKQKWALQASCNSDLSRNCYFYLRQRTSHFYVISPENSQCFFKIQIMVSMAIPSRSVAPWSRFNAVFHRKHESLPSCNSLRGAEPPLLELQHFFQAVFHL